MKRLLGIGFLIAFMLFGRPGVCRRPGAPKPTAPRQSNRLHRLLRPRLHLLQLQQQRPRTPKPDPSGANSGGAGDVVGASANAPTKEDMEKLSAE